MQKRAIKNERGRSACNDFSCDYFLYIFAKEEFYSANEAYEEDTTKSFNSVNPTTKHIQCHTFQVYLPSHGSPLCNGDVTPRRQNVPLRSLDNKELMRFADLSGHQLPMISSV